MTFEVDRLAALPPDPAGTCALAGDLVRDWLPFVPLADEPDVTDPGLPTALRWVHGHLGPAGGRLFGIQDPLVPHALLEPDSHGVVTFRTENQGVVAWGYRPEAGDDPPVLLGLRHRDPRDGSPWVPHQDRLSVHLLEGVLEGTLYLGEHAANMAATPEALAALAQVPALGITPHPMWTDPEGPGRVRWHALPEAVVRNDADTWLWAVGRTAADLLRVLVAVPGEWESFS